MTGGASSPLGVFDSGVGGLTVVAALRERLPNESILYLGDTARLPYGTKSQQTVLRYTRTTIGFLRERGVKAVVVACNTASALAVPYLDRDGDFDLPLWGVIEAGAARAASLSEGRVGVIATESTVRSDAYAQALLRERPDLRVTSRACPLFVPLVEEGWHDDPIAEAVAHRYVDPLIDEGIDTLVLGCTHYPLLVPVLSRVVGDGVRLVDSASSVAERVARDLAASGLEAPAGNPAAGDLHAYVTDTADRFARLARSIVGDDVSFELVDVT